MSYKRWNFLQLDKETAGLLSEECGLDPVLCLLLTGRGITDGQQAMDFLSGDELMGDPFLFANMDAAVDRIQSAMDEGELIMIYGDYDADGITATVLLYTYLKQKGARVQYALPHREGEGYGLHRETIDRMIEQGVNLIVTVDNGISAADEVAYAAQHGIDVVVTDHHKPPEHLPNAVAVVDPHRRDCPSPFKDFAGVGMAFFLVCALEGDTDRILAEYADLVALGTLADVMPLHDDNRLLVRKGLQQISAGTRDGLSLLREAAGTATRPQTASNVAFTLAPRINAAGRMGDPEKAAALLLGTADEATAQLAREIQEMNTARQTVEAEILTEIRAQLENDPKRLADRVLVVCGNGWHHGVLGILAARLLDLYGKPTLVLSETDGIARGSGRSVVGFSLYDALCACDDCLLAFGGHEQAAGITVEAARVDEFTARINAYAADVCPRMPIEELTMDCRLRPSQITPDLVACLSALEPFGAGNPQPLFGLFGMRVERIEEVGGGKHLRLTLSRDGVTVTAMKFSTTLDAFHFAVGDTVNTAVLLERNDYRGTPSVSIIVKDIRYADTVQDDLLQATADYDAVVRREDTDVPLPSREKAASVYRFLKRAPYHGTIECLHHLIGDPTLTFTDTYLCLQLLWEADLIDYRNGGNTVTVTVRQTDKKTDLAQTETARFLQRKE